MKNNNHKVAVFAGFMGTLVFLSCATQVCASIKEMKAYKEAFPGAAVKCATCHSAAMPKKDTAGLNDYGEAAMADGPNVETFKKLGKAEDFTKK